MGDYLFMNIIYLDPGRYVSLGMPYGKQATNPGWGGITLRLRKLQFVCIRTEYITEDYACNYIRKKY